MQDSQLTLACGRRLGYAEIGAPEGLPVMYFHGFPGSRLEAAFAGPTATSLGVRLIAADRPGIGMSDVRQGRTILDSANDARALADHLGLDAFSVLGVSGGAPYALACAFKLERRIRSAAIVSGVGPPAAIPGASLASTSGVGLRMVAAAPWLAIPFATVLGALARHASPVLLGMLSARVSHQDRLTLRNPGFRAILSASLRESFRSGNRGAVTELRLLSTPWGFDLSALRAPVHIWHGGKDRVVPISMGRFLEHALHDCRATYMREHGHYSLVHDCVEQILAHMTRRSPTRPSC
jgi:pimeloyl-ACP methyl ester carboxylesterase